MPTANQSRYGFRLEPKEIDRAAERIFEADDYQELNRETLRQLQ